MPATKLTRDELVELLASQAGPDDDFAVRAIEVMGDWFARGDGCAVYRNEDIGHPMMGLLKFVSYGSKEAQLVTPGGLPPNRLPDIGDEINWRYMLLGYFNPSK